LRRDSELTGEAAKIAVFLARVNRDLRYQMQRIDASMEQ
jgi:hypothetical protein